MLPAQRATLTFYVLRVRFTGPVLPGLQTKLHAQVAQDGELSVSPHVSLCGGTKGAWLDSPSLAREYREALAPVFARRYGEGVAEIEVVESTTPLRAKAELKIREDSQMVRARLEQKVLAPNRRPALPPA